ncbi:U1 zinc finger-domain-containing protein [Scenedesmus sp. NREL 46B-D3]|nr:U1 zinc finger-domain-containing protein [Scenedesmus sp. NREL 46B-D3]
MPRFYCDFCDAYLTHDSPAVRSQHNSGYKHKANVRNYYMQFTEGPNADGPPGGMDPHQPDMMHMRNNMQQRDMPPRMGMGHGHGPGRARHGAWHGARRHAPALHGRARHGATTR